MSQRYGSTVRLRPEKRAEYLALHAAVWPHVEEQIRASNIRNYTIFLHGDQLFSYFEYIGDDFEADQALMAADATTREWWALTDPCQERIDGREEGPMWTAIEEVWHLE